MKVIETKRLILRTWTDEDIKPWYLMNNNPKVLEFLRGPMTMEEAEAYKERTNNLFKTKNHCFWACELKDTKEFMGFVGLNIPQFESHFTPCVDIGWRLDSKFWGKGYATEGAEASLEYGFNKLLLEEIISFTSVKNIRSRNVMEKIGMVRNPKDDFDHPKLPLDSPLSKHVLYKINKSIYNKRNIEK